MQAQDVAARIETSIEPRLFKRGNAAVVARTARTAFDFN